MTPTKTNKSKSANKSNATATTTKAINYVHAKSHQAVTDFFSWFSTPKEFYSALDELQECALESELSDDRDTRCTNLKLLACIKQLGKDIL